MGKYEGVNCPICNKPLENGEDVVVCPDCGAPYHHKCIRATGQCIYTDLHKEGKAWEMPKKEEEFVGEEPRKCSRCGTTNPVNGIFCEVCGNPLNRNTQTAEQQAKRNTPYPNMDDDITRYNTQNPYNQHNQHNHNGTPFQMPLNPYTTPFGGLSPDETIEEVEIKDVAIFVGQNTPYFLPKFKEYSKKARYITFNFAAALFQGFYFLYRKMYMLGALILIASIMLSIPNALISVDYFTESFDVGFKTSYTNDTLITANNICATLQFMLRVLCGFFANKVYKTHTFDKIKNIKSQNLTHEEYIQTLTKKGSVSTKVIGILLVAYMGFSFIASIIIMVFM